MLVELRDVEINVEPKQILIQALKNGCITVETIVEECIKRDGSAYVLLGAIPYIDIDSFCKETGISKMLPNIDEIILASKELNQTDKAKLLWLLLKG